MLIPLSGSVWLAAGGVVELASARSSRRIQLQEGALEDAIFRCSLPVVMLIWQYSPFEAVLEEGAGP